MEETYNVYISMPVLVHNWIITIIVLGGDWRVSWSLKDRFSSFLLLLSFFLFIYLFTWNRWAPNITAGRMLFPANSIIQIVKNRQNIKMKGLFSGQGRIQNFTQTFYCHNASNRVNKITSYDYASKLKIQYSIWRSNFEGKKLLFRISLDYI